MITFSRLGRYGNLGNSMFQLAATIGIAAKLNFEVKLPRNPTYFDTNYNCNNISIFDGFDVNIPVLTVEEYRNIKNFYTEPHFHYDNKAFEISDNTDLTGYFQSEKYFLPVKSLIKKTFTFKKEIIEKSNNLFKEYNIEPSQTVSLHIRRGDYVVKQEYHPLQDSSYYQTAFKKAKLKNVLVFSDDVTWCQKNIQGSNIYYTNTGNSFADMRAMSLCKNNIIVNSTFGWWGAWLNEDPDKVVIAPTKWFGPAYSNIITNDILPEQWIKI